LICLVSFLVVNKPLAVEKPATDSKEEMVRVAVMKNATLIKITGDDLAISDENGNVIHSDGNPVLISYENSSSMLLNGVSHNKIVVSGNSVFRVNDKGYRGTIGLYPKDKGILVINELPLEKYLVGLVNCEISSKWPIEAIKAQVIVARTYALYKKHMQAKSQYHLESTVLDQAYDGADKEDDIAEKAVEDTKGQVLLYNGQLIQAFYHSCCGGHTESAKNVWGVDLPYLRGVKCDSCLNSPFAKWHQSISLSKINSLLNAAGYKINGLKNITPGKTDESGRLEYLILKGNGESKVIRAVDFRRIMGYSVIKSTAFTVDIQGDDVNFNGMGNGHGVGLCQWGARQKAIDGATCKEILSFYYPGTELKQLNYN